MAANQKEYNIGITDYVLPPADIETDAFPEARFHFLDDWRKSPQSREQWQKMDAILVWHWHIDSETIEQLTNCKIVARYGVGYDLVDVQALNANNLPFANTPDYGTEEVADTACAMILTILRKIGMYDRLCRTYTDKWQENLLRPHQRTSDQTLGLIGVGRIGTAVVNRMKPFGCKIIGYDPYQPSGHEKAVGYNRVNSLDELLSQADIISIHCPLTEETEGMVDEDFINRMKPGGALVNTARGKIVANLDCLEKALKNNQLSLAALDVLPQEPPTEHPLIDAWRQDASWLQGRLLINPHAAYYSERGWYEMRYKAAETARLFLMENRLRNQITQ